MGNTHSFTLIFRLSCWLIAVMGFAQILIAGVSIAMRMEQTRAVKVVEKLVPAPVVSAPTPLEVTPEPEIAQVIPPPAPFIEPEPTPFVAPSSAPIPLPPPRPLVAPITADPLAERLVQQAKAARLGEDMMTAVTKLEQALKQSPNDGNALYELALCHETMGIFDRARQLYHQVYQLGTTGAGELYLLAAEKLKRGFEQPIDKVNRIVLGRARVFKDPQLDKGEKVILTIPVQAVPGEQIDGRDLEVIVNFFDEIGARKEINPADTTNSKFEYKWLTEPLDWSTGEELLQVTYTIPRQDLQQAHLFGDRRYHGQVVELSYKGELIDAQAWPRILAHKMNKPDASPVFLDRDLPAGFNPENPLLPNPDWDAPHSKHPPDYSKENLPPPPEDLPGHELLPLPVPEEYRNPPKP